MTLHDHRRAAVRSIAARDGALDGVDGAPTAGPPPYEVYEVTPAVVFGFGTNDTFASRSTRWRFSP